MTFTGWTWARPEVDAPSLLRSVAEGDGAEEDHGHHPDEDEGEGDAAALLRRWAHGWDSDGLRGAGDSVVGEEGSAAEGDDG